MRTTKVAVIALGMMLTGCASVGETMATKEPNLVLQTAKTPEAYRDCIVDSTEFAEVTITDRGDGFIFVSPKLASQVFTAMPNQAGAEIKVWGLAGTRKIATRCT